MEAAAFDVDGEFLSQRFTTLEDMRFLAGETQAKMEGLEEQKRQLDKMTALTTTMAREVEALIKEQQERQEEYDKDEHERGVKEMKELKRQNQSGKQQSLSEHATKKRLRDKNNRAFQADLDELSRDIEDLHRFNDERRKEREEQWKRRQEQINKEAHRKWRH